MVNYNIRMILLKFDKLNMLKKNKILINMILFINFILMVYDCMFGDL